MYKESFLDANTYGSVLMGSSLVIKRMLVLIPFLYIVFLQEAFWHFTEIFSHFAYWPVEYSFIVQSIAVPHKGSQ